MIDIHVSAFRVTANDLPELKMPYGKWYIGRVIDGADSYLHKDLTVHSSTHNKNNNGSDAYFYTREEAQAILDKYINQCKEEAQAVLASLETYKKDSTNANQEA